MGRCSAHALGIALHQKYCPTVNYKADPKISGRRFWLAFIPVRRDSNFNKQDFTLFSSGFQCPCMDEEGGKKSRSCAPLSTPAVMLQVAHEAKSTKNGNFSANQMGSAPFPSCLSQTSGSSRSAI